MSVLSMWILFNVSLVIVALYVLRDAAHNRKEERVGVAAVGYTIGFSLIALALILSWSSLWKITQFALKMFG